MRGSARRGVIVRRVVSFLLLLKTEAEFEVGR